ALDLHHNNSQFAQRPVSDSAFNFGAGDFTIQVWANFYDSSGEQVLIEKFTGSSGPGWTLTKLSSNQLQFFSNATGGLTSPVQNIPTGVWHQIIARRSGNTFTILFDDQAVVATTGSGAITDSTLPLLVGRRDSLDGRDFSANARLDETAIWTRALSG